MNVYKRPTAVAILLATLGGLALAACHTVEGAGKDIKSAGKAIEEEAEEHH